MKESKIRSLNEDNGYLTYQILSIKSSSNLGIRMLNEDSDMDFVDSADVQFFSMPGEIASDENVIPVAHLNQQRSGFLNGFLKFGAQAEATGLE